MARVKNLLNHIFIETAKARRRCHHKGTHAIIQGMPCLVVVDSRGSKRNYCTLCAKPMLDEAMQKLAQLGFGLSTQGPSTLQAIAD